MRDLVADVLAWQAAGHRVALATQVAVRGSAPMALGARMAISDGGEVSGSISGGCVEASVVTDALGVIESGRARRVTYGVDADELGGVGLTCGGEITVFVAPLSPDTPDAPVLATLRRHLEEGSGVAWATVLDGNDPATPPGAPPGASLVVDDLGTPTGSLGDATIDEAAVAAAAAALTAGATGEQRLAGAEGGCTVFIDAIVESPRLIVFGAVEFARALTDLAAVLGYRSVVVDHRATFATAARFPHAGEILVCRPEEFFASTPLTPRDVICVLTHDPKVDEPALCAAVRSPARYVGAMGSRRTTADRARRLRHAGLSAEEVAAIHAPIGLDLGATTPAETALAILAEVVADRSGRRGEPLGGTDAPIHG